MTPYVLAVPTAVAQLLPFFAKAVTSIMRYTGLLVAVLIVLLFFYSPDIPGFITKVFSTIYHWIYQVICFQ